MLKSHTLLCYEVTTFYSIDNFGENPSLRLHAKEMYSDVEQEHYTTLCQNTLWVVEFSVYNQNHQNNSNLHGHRGSFLTRTTQKLKLDEKMCTFSN